ncbi:MAG: type II secretion system F family protein [Alphaproteobacteria bacterium]|nr:type II secretion system F family protein [Alphaproteobacteria bacterium]MCL2505477.1 type II secretion system F family protein [Alphaproteobacteria bacterium]
MSNVQEKMNQIDAWLMRFQFRNNTRMRHRIWRKLEGMLKANEALSRALDRLYQNVTEMGKYPNRPAAVALRDWFVQDRAGISLAQAMSGWVPPEELYLIRAGEESGSLAKTLGFIQKMGQRRKQMKQAVQAAVGYPAALFVLIGFVIWTFSINLIANMRLHAPPRVVASMGAVVPFSDFVAAYGLYIVAAVIITCMIIIVSLPRWQGRLRSKFDMYPPYSWYRVLQGSGFLMGLSALLGAQVPLKRSMEILEEEGTPWIRERIGSARENVLRGQNLGEALRRTKYNFPAPEVAVDLEILAERADVGAVIEMVADEWMEDQVESMNHQAVVIRNIGLVIVGGIIAWTMMAIFNVVGELSRAGGQVY